MRIAVLSLLLQVVVLATSIQEIVDLRESGFSEKEILELVNQDTQYEAKDFISLKKAEFNSDFILKLKKKTEKRATDSISLSNDDLYKGEIEKFQINYPRAITRLRDQTYSTPGLFAHDGKVLKRNGFDESLDAPRRDLPRMKELLLASVQHFIDKGNIGLLDIGDLLDAWLEWKVISIRNIAYRQLCREEFIPIPDGYDDPMLDAEKVFNVIAQDLKSRIDPTQLASSITTTTGTTQKIGAPTFTPPTSPPQFSHQKSNSVDLSDTSVLDRLISNAVEVKDLKEKDQGDGEMLYFTLDSSGKEVPFDGWGVVFNKFGKIDILSEFKNGNRYDGKIANWFDNGQRSHELNFRNGKLLSAHAWKYDGTKCPETHIKNGNGLLVQWHEDGTRLQETNFKDGLRNGLSVISTKSGMKTKINYLNGKMHGTSVMIFPGGAKSESNWVNGKRAND